MTNNSGQDIACFTCSDWVKGNVRVGCYGTVALPDTSIATANSSTTNKAINPEEVKAVTQYVERFLALATVKRGNIRKYEVYSNEK
jgi:hypothetical protein